MTYAIRVGRKAPGISLQPWKTPIEDARGWSDATTVAVSHCIFCTRAGTTWTRSYTEWKRDGRDGTDVRDVRDGRDDRFGAEEH
jgi:hypothetical protein